MGGWEEGWEQGSVEEDRGRQETRGTRERLGEGGMWGFVACMKGALSPKLFPEKGADQWEGIN